MAHTRALQHLLSPLDDRPGDVDLATVRQRIEQLAAAGGNAQIFSRVTDEEERQRLIRGLSDMSLQHLRKATAGPSNSESPQTADAMLDQFLECQRERMERRKKLDKLRA